MAPEHAGKIRIVDNTNCGKWEYAFYVEEAKAAVADLGLDTCPVTFGERADFHRSSSKGEVASEIDANGKAAREVKALWKWVKKALT